MTAAIKKALGEAFPALVERSTGARDRLAELGDLLRAHAIAHEDVRRLCAEHTVCDAYMTGHLLKVRGGTLQVTADRLVRFAWKWWESFPSMPADVAARYARCAPITLGLFADEASIEARGGRRALPPQESRVGLANSLLEHHGPRFGFRVSTSAAPHVLTPMEQSDVLGLSAPRAPRAARRASAESWRGKGAR